MGDVTETSEEKCFRLRLKGGRILSVQALKIPSLGALAGFLIGIFSWMIATAIRWTFHLSPAGEINLGRATEYLLLPLTLLLLFFLSLVVPDRMTLWRVEISTLTGFCASFGLFVALSVYRAVWGMRYEYLQVNDWSSYFSFEMLANGYPMFLLGAISGFGVAKFRNRKIARQNSAPFEERR